MDDIAPIIQRHGWAVQAVLGDGPASPPFAYTVGLHPRVPELLVVGACPSHALETLNELAARLRADPRRVDVGDRFELSAGSPWHEVRIGEVAPIWSASYALRAHAHHGTDDPAQLRIRQVVLPDPDGRFPEDPGFSEDILARQPLLDDPERPWRIVLGMRDVDPLEWEGSVSTHVVLLPVVVSGRPSGMEEAVPVRPLGDASYSLLAQPCLADWCGPGAIVEATPVDEPVRGVGDVEVFRFARVERESRMLSLRWELRHEDDAGARRILDTVVDLPFDELHIGSGALPHALTLGVQARHAEPLRLRMRRLERDGLVRQRELVHVREEIDLAARHDGCPECRRMLNGWPRSG